MIRDDIFNVPPNPANSAMPAAKKGAITQTASIKVLKSVVII